jgi:hypothetical protein
MKLVDSSAVQVSVPSNIADEILNNVERSARVGGGDVLFYWDYDEVNTVVRIVDMYQPNSSLPDIPSPILRDYDWPGIFKPFNHRS